MSSLPPNPTSPVSGVPALATPGGARSVGALSEFWHWWMSELKGAVPPALSGWFIGEVATTDVVVNSTAITLVRTDAGALHTRAAITHEETSSHPLIRGLITQGHDAVRLLLRADQVLVTRVTLPLAVEENLAETIGFELDRFTPFKREQVFFDAKIVQRDSQKETLAVLLAVVAKQSLEPLRASLQRAGLTLASVGLDPAVAGGESFELLPESEKPARKWGNLLRLNLALFVTACVVGLIAVVLPIWQKRERVIELIPQVGKASQEFETSKRVHEEYTRLANDFNYISTKKHTLQPAIVLIEELARISPDTTFVQTLDLKTSGKIRELTLQGEAQSASKVIESLEQSTFFQNAAQRSQTTRGSQGERFHIATEVKPKPLPPATVQEPIVEPVAAPVPGTAPGTTPPPAPAAVTAPGKAGSAENGASAPTAAAPSAAALPAAAPVGGAAPAVPASGAVQPPVMNPPSAPPDARRATPPAKKTP